MTDSPVSVAPTPHALASALYEAPVNRRIYVGGLTSPATDTWLRELCAPYGTVTSAYVIRSKLTGQPFGYGFVEMRSREEAEEVIMALNGTRLEGQRLDVFLCREARYGEPGQRISGALDSDA